MKNYDYTVDWFGPHDIEKILPVGTIDELHVLEIGSYEGKSTVWFIENLLGNSRSTITCIDPWEDYSQNENSFNEYGNKGDDSCLVKTEKVKDRFLYNINETEKINQCRIIQGYSHESLFFLNQESKKYDVIFIDGNHTAPFVLTDAVLSWCLLKVGGCIIFDDYMWEAHKSETLRPQLSIDSFTKIFSDYLEVVWKESRVIIRKIK